MTLHTPSLVLTPPPTIAEDQIPLKTRIELLGREGPVRRVRERVDLDPQRQIGVGRRVAVGGPELKVHVPIQAAAATAAVVEEGDGHERRPPAGRVLGLVEQYGGDVVAGRHGVLRPRPDGDHLLRVAEPVITPHPFHDAELEELFLAARRPAADIPLIRAPRIPEPLARAIAAAPLSPAPGRRRGYGHAVAAGAGRVDGVQLVHDAASAAGGRRGRGSRHGRRRRGDAAGGPRRGAGGAAGLGVEAEIE
ncbi:hypothetical protein PG993_002320 [Apiospora rasikravindrae]|uniref:Uncharacterized protein n=1 Tax=Apiospora rasikravindrae TaxID=990691 RepID=A0ABR1TWB0_9PEZI